MIRKYWWLVVFAVFVFLFDTLLMQWIELLTTETDKCLNMNSVNPLKLVNCDELNAGTECGLHDMVIPFDELISLCFHLA